MEGVARKNETPRRAKMTLCMDIMLDFLASMPFTNLCSLVAP